VEITKEVAMKNNFLLKLILFVAALFILWILREPLFSAWEWFSDRDAVTASMNRTGIWSFLILFILFVLQVFLAFIPGQALMVACGYLYGFWGGFLLSWLSLAVGGEAAFALARRYGRSFANKWISSEILARWDKAAEGQGIGFYTLALVLPLIPNDAMCYVAGLGKISQRRFSVANLLGRGIACVVTSWIGAFRPHAPLYVWIILIVIASGIAGWFMYKKAGSFPDAKNKLANACGILIANFRQNSLELAENHPNRKTIDEYELIYQKMIIEKGTQKNPVSSKSYFHWKQIRESSIWRLMDRFG
jgi:uncharacterized membrane protein YdjX (TVP38/TMEM64 family)